MSEKKPPTPQAVGTFLGKRFTRSTSTPTRVKGCPLTSAGFTARGGTGLPGKVEHVSVEYTFGDRGQYMQSARRLKLTQENLIKMQEHLEQRYTVTRNSDGPDWDSLLVFNKEED